MIEIRFHGRGGQGAVLASNILSEAAFNEGKIVQAFPFFGVERRGAPVTSFVRISDTIIRAKYQIYTPDYVVVLDSSLIGKIDVTNGLKTGGALLINTDSEPESFNFGNNFKIATVDASGIAVRLGLGGKTAPIVNTAILGAFSKFTNIVSIDSVLKAIYNKVPLKKDKNIIAAKKSYEEVKF